MEPPELEELRYAAAYTTIPITKVYRVHQYQGKLAIEMEYLEDCHDLRVAWRELSDQQKDAIVDEISGYIKQLRELEPMNQNEYEISSTSGGLCRDIRVGSVKLFWPFDKSFTFHECLRGGIDMETGKMSFGEHFIQVHICEYRTRYTHGGLTAYNILVRDGRVAAIVNWECAG